MQTFPFSTPQLNSCQAPIPLPAGCGMEKKKPERFGNQTQQRPRQPGNPAVSFHKPTLPSCQALRSKEKASLCHQLAALLGAGKTTRLDSKAGIGCMAQVRHSGGGREGCQQKSSESSFWDTRHVCTATYHPIASADIPWGNGGGGGSTECCFSAQNFFLSSVLVCSPVTKGI